MKKKAKKHENSERWLLTYSDLITLLMILFVVLYAMSNVSQSKYEGLSESLNNALGSGESKVSDTILEDGTGILEGNGILSDIVAIVPPETSSNSNEQTGQASNESSVGNSAKSQAEKFAELRKDILNVMKNNEIKENVYITMEESGLVITFVNNVIFDSGSADIKEEMKASLDQIAQLLKRLDNPIQIEGHTDNVPTNNRNFSSNWQLSSIRAANIVQYLVEKGNIEPDRLSAVGYGEYRPLEPNTTEKGRQHNRRIRINILYNNEDNE